MSKMNAYHLSCRLALFTIGLFCCSAARGQWIESPSALHITFPDARLKVNGLPWFSEDQPHLWRLPVRLKKSFRTPVWSLAQQPSGGRIRFATDSTKIGMIA